MLGCLLVREAGIEGGVLGVINKHVQRDREEAQKGCCGVQMDSVKLILELRSRLCLLFGSEQQLSRSAAVPPRPVRTGHKLTIEIGGVFMITTFIFCLCAHIGHFSVEST